MLSSLNISNRGSWVPRCIFVAVLLCGTIHLAAAQSPRETLQRAEEFLRIGDADQALALLRELQVDRPDDDMVLYGIAMAHHRQAERLLEQEALAPALEALSEAREAYVRLGAQSGDPEVAANARYNSASLQAEASKLQFNPEEYEAGVARIRAAIEALEAVVTQYPDHAAARHNLEHMRLTLKTILSNPPESEESEEESEEQPQDSPAAYSLFEFAETDLPEANVEVMGEGDTVILRPSPTQGGSAE